MMSERFAKLHLGPNLRFLRRFGFLANRLWPKGYVNLRETEPTQKSSNLTSKASVASLSFDILSLFPEYFQGPFSVSILKRAIEKGIIEIRHTNIRDFATDKHRKVDERPFGGGPGMVLMPEPLTKAIRSKRREESKVIYLSPQGKPLTAKICERLAEASHLILVCGHYEGIDQRIIDSEVDEEISIGDYVLTNGCLAAIVLVDATVRFIPGVLGNAEAAQQDSFQKGIFDAPHYTVPREFEGVAVPDVLLGGNHASIEKWREEEAMKNTRRVRPELFKEQV